MLSGAVQSCAYNPYEYDNAAAVVAGVLQMAMAGGTTLAEAGGDPCYGIPDLSSARSFPIRCMVKVNLQLASYSTSTNVPKMLDRTAAFLSLFCGKPKTSIAEVH